MNSKSEASFFAELIVEASAIFSSLPNHSQNCCAFRSILSNIGFVLQHAASNSDYYQKAKLPVKLHQEDDSGENGGASDLGRLAGIVAFRLLLQIWFCAD